MFVFFHWRFSCLIRTPYFYTINCWFPHLEVEQSLLWSFRFTSRSTMFSDIGLLWPISRSCCIEISHQKSKNGVDLHHLQNFPHKWQMNHWYVPNPEESDLEGLICGFYWQVSHQWKMVWGENSRASTPGLPWRLRRLGMEVAAGQGGGVRKQPNGRDGWKFCLCGGFRYFVFSPWELAKTPILTNIFQRGW